VSFGIALKMIALKCKELPPLSMLMYEVRGLGK